MKNKMIGLTLALASATCLLSTLPAQDSNPGPGVPPGPGGRPGPGGPGGPRMNPVIAVLDLDPNGTIDSEEIAKASESLKKLDKNGDGKITPDEHRPQRPPGGPGGPGDVRPPRPQPE